MFLKQVVDFFFILAYYFAKLCSYSQFFYLLCLLLDEYRIDILSSNILLVAKLLLIILKFTPSESHERLFNSFIFSMRKKVFYFLIN